MKNWFQLRRWWQRWHPRPTLGKRGERAAEKFLKRQGFVIVARGERDRIGELDLIAVDRATSPPIASLEIIDRGGTRAVARTGRSAGPGSRSGAEPGGHRSGPSTVTPR